MANRFFGEATVKVNGKTYTLRCDFNAMCFFEEATGKDAMEVFAEFEAGKFSAILSRQVMHSFLQEHHPDAELKEAGAILSEDPSILQKVIRNGSPDAGEIPAPGKPKTPRKRGKKATS